ncbi:hypothetical protein CEXT_54121 [Caerostris extrusa]|uniref:LAGLIDADG homing endonuclease n=1 Tax=Caerostris extrusa TaxID=172846 RepID=A0AAV4NQ97_CAEEX|nr:hypothetical protein CEXT_54121 [Caerostris extrusa]
MTVSVFQESGIYATSRTLLKIKQSLDNSDNGKLFQSLAGDGIKSRCRFNFRIFDEDGNFRRHRTNNIIGVVLIEVIDSLAYRVCMVGIRNWVKLKLLFEFYAMSSALSKSLTEVGTNEVRNFRYRAFGIFCKIAN